jgi:putative salt-induced outer membrane protein YdiY
MKGFFKLLLASSIIAMTGCTTMTSTPAGAEAITITKNPVSSNCKWKGNVSVSDEAKMMDTHSFLKSDEYNRLKKQAMQLGANTIQLSPSSGMAVEKHWVAKSKHRERGTHRYTGKAYWCPN